MTLIIKLSINLREGVQELRVFAIYSWEHGQITYEDSKKEAFLVKGIRTI